MKIFLTIFSLLLLLTTAGIFADHYLLNFDSCHVLANLSPNTSGINRHCPAKFYYPNGIAKDSQGNLYVSESGNHVIRKISPKGVVTLFAGRMGIRGHSDGKFDEARFQSPAGLAFDSEGNLYVADQGNDIVRKITPEGFVSTIAGLSETKGFSDGLGAEARFNAPMDVVVRKDLGIFVSDIGNNTVRLINLEGKVSTFLGSAGKKGSANGCAYCNESKVGRFNGISGMGIGGETIYIADTYNYLIRKIKKNNDLLTISGTAASVGAVDGPADVANYKTPFDVTSNNKGTVFVLDSGNDLIRQIDTKGIVTTLKLKSKNGGPDVSKLHFPRSLLWSEPNILYLTDTTDQTVKKITLPEGEVEIIAGVSGKRGRVNTR